jgi:hypothetical protein
MLHGRYDEASTMLVADREQLSQQRQILRDQANLPELLAAWYESAEQAYADVARASRAVGDPSALPRARARLASVWKDGEKLISALLAGSAADPLVGLMTYFLALTKHEQAEILQLRASRHGTESGDAGEAARQAWKSAADWWDTYLTENATAPKAASARLLRAEALEKLGQRDAAQSLLLDASGNRSALEEVGRLYRLRQLQQQAKGKS